MLITFEGIDGSGKSTQAKLLSRTLRDQGHTVLEVREPGGTALGEHVRDLLLDPSASVDPVAELLLFSAARAQLTNTVIAPALDQGQIVIADRFSDSTVAYQGQGRKVADLETIVRLQLLATSRLQPTRTYLIDVPLEVALQRRGGIDDRIESEGQAFYERVREGYRLIASATDRVRVVNGLRSPESVSADVWLDVSNLLEALNEKSPTVD